MQTVAEALALARTLGLERLDAQLIVAWQLGQSRTWVIAHDDTALAPPLAAASSLESPRSPDRNTAPPAPP